MAPEDPPLPGLAAEPGQPPGFAPGSAQIRGGHMRMIVGYNEFKKQVLFSDTWGAGHEKKQMALHWAYQVTDGLYTLTPRTY